MLSSTIQLQYYFSRTNPSLYQIDLAYTTFFKMTSTTTTAPPLRVVSLASIKANTPDEKDKQLVLTLVVEFLRCLQEDSARVEGRDKSKAIGGLEMRKIFGELLDALKRLKEQYLHEEVENIYHECKVATNPETFWEGNRPWAPILFQVLLEIPGYLDPKDLDGGAEVKDEGNLLNFAGYTVRGDSDEERVWAKLQDCRVLVRWEELGFHKNFRYAMNRVRGREQNRLRGEREEKRKLERTGGQAEPSD